VTGVHRAVTSGDMAHSSGWRAARIGKPPLATIAAPLVTAAATHETGRASVIRSATGENA